MTNFEWLAKSYNLIDFLYDLTENKEDEFLVNESKKSNDLVSVIHNLIDTAIYGPTDIATNEEDVFLVDVLKKWDIPPIPNHTGEWAIAKWLVSPREEKNIFNVERNSATEIDDVFEEEEIHENCTVQILRNSATGEESIGWWKNE